jgi:hypothetical protein
MSEGLNTRQTGAKARLTLCPQSEPRREVDAQGNDEVPFVHLAANTRVIVLVTISVPSRISCGREDSAIDRFWNRIKIGRSFADSSQNRTEQFLENVPIPALLAI